MKKYLAMLLALLTLTAACGNPNSQVTALLEGEQPPAADSRTAAAQVGEATPAENTAPVDLTQLSSTMLYGEVANMMREPVQYIGRQVKMQGTFQVYEDKKQGKNYYACLIQDATACCAQGIEFVLAGQRAYPEDYPAVDEQITVEGVFQTYTEQGMTFCHLVDARLLS